MSSDRYHPCTPTESQGRLILEGRHLLASTALVSPSRICLLWAYCVPCDATISTCRPTASECRVQIPAHEPQGACAPKGRSRFGTHQASSGDIQTIGNVQCKLERLRVRVRARIRRPLPGPSSRRHSSRAGPMYACTRVHELQGQGLGRRPLRLSCCLPPTACLLGRGRTSDVHHTSDEADLPESPLR